MGCGSSVAVSSSKDQKKSSIKKINDRSTDKSNRLPPIQNKHESDEEIDTRTENLEPFTVVSLDDSFDENDKELRSIIDFVLCFNDREKCKKYLIDNQQNSLIFLIISVDHIQNLVSQIHHLSQIYSIYAIQNDSPPPKNIQQLKKKFVKVNHLNDYFFFKRQKIYSSCSENKRFLE